MRIVSAALAAILLCGCTGQSEPKIAPKAAVSGKVLHGGQPVKAGTVVFEDREKGNVTAVKFTDGAFQHPGVPEGKHSVYVTPPEAPPSTDPGKPNPPPEAPDIPAKFRDPKTSKLEAEVKKDGANDFEFKLDE